MTLQQDFPDFSGFADQPVPRLIINHLNIWIFTHDVIKTLRPTLSSCMALLTPGLRDFPFAAHLLDQLLHDIFSQRDIVRGDKGHDAHFFDLWQRRDQRVHVDYGNACFTDSLYWLNECTDTVGLHNNEIPVSQRDVIDGVKLRRNVPTAVEPGEIDAEPTAI